MSTVTKEAIYDAIIDCLHDFEYDNSPDMITLRVPTGSFIRSVRCTLIPDEDSIMFRATCPIKADPENQEMMRALYRAICRANYCSKRGGFMVDPRDGEIEFRYKAICYGQLPDAQFIIDLISLAISSYRREELSLLTTTIPVKLADK